MIRKRKTCLNCFSLLLGLLLLPGWYSCKRKPFYEADISDVLIDSLMIKRYESVLFELNPFALQQELKPHLDEYAFFLGDALDDQDAMDRLYDYVTDPLLIDLYLDTRERWPDLRKLEEQLTKAFRYYLYHFPDATIPQVFTYISGIDYQYPIKYDEGHIIIALDTYMGGDYRYYDMLGIPRYRARWMQPDRVVVDLMEALATERLNTAVPAPDTFLEHMIHEGKRLYFMDCMLPGIHDTLKIAYTAQQAEWMQRNEGYSWTYKLNNQLLYNADHQAIQKFIRNAPFTAPFSNQSAPRTGVWIGWQIVRSYMRLNPEVSLEELLQETDARIILNGARYRP